MSTHDTAALRQPVIWILIYVFPCLANSANFIYGQKEAKVRRHVTALPAVDKVEDRGWTNNFLCQVMGSASEGKYNTVNNTTSWEVI